MKIETCIPVLGIAAYSGTGKTTLLMNLVPLLKEKGKRVGVIKHAHHDFEIDKPGKDSYKIRKAGADLMLIGSQKRWALMVEREEDNQTKRLQEYVSYLNRSTLDIILVEGFKPEVIPKIELHRVGLGHPLICETDESVIALATDVDIDVRPDMTLLDLNDHRAIAEFIIRKFCAKSSRS